MNTSSRSDDRPRASEVPRPLAALLLIALVVGTVVWFGLRVGGLQLSWPAGGTDGPRPRAPESSAVVDREERKGGRATNRATENPGQEATRLPDLVGQSLTDVEQRLDDLGLRHRVIREPSTVSSGTVVATVPASGTMVNVGDRVRLTVSSGPAPPPVVVVIKEDGNGGVLFDPATVHVRPDQPVELRNISQTTLCELEITGISMRFSTGGLRLEAGGISALHSVETGTGRIRCQGYGSGLGVTLS